MNLFADALPRGSRGVVPGAWAAELQALRASLATRPSGLDAWRTVLDDVRDQLASVGTLLHEIEEADDSKEQGPLPSAGEAGHWLERAAVLAAGRAAELKTLTGWIRTDDPETRRWRTAPVPTLAQLTAWRDETLAALEQRPDAGALRAAIEAAGRQADELVDRADRLAALADDLLEEIEFDFLTSPERQLFAIGYSVADGRLDNSHYDLLASEARLASFIAIATGKLPQEHWFKLGRALTPAGGRRALLSWSGSMFEYPDAAARDAVAPRYAARRDLRRGAATPDRLRRSQRRPVGVSESAYNVTDLDGNYQYRAFGVPGLGLKRGLGDDLVVAPYATMLAAPLAPGAVVATCSGCRLKDWPAASGSMRRSTTRPNGCPRMPRVARCS